MGALFECGALLRKTRVSVLRAADFSFLELRAPYLVQNDRKHRLGGTYCLRFGVRRLLIELFVKMYLLFTIAHKRFVEITF